MRLSAKQATETDIKENIMFLEKLCAVTTMTSIAVFGTLADSSEEVCIECDIDKSYDANPTHERVQNKDFCNLKKIETDAKYFEDTIRVLQKDRKFRAHQIIIALSNTRGGIAVFAKFLSDGVAVGLCGGRMCVDDLEESENRCFYYEMHAELNKLGDELENAQWLVESIEFTRILDDIRNSGGLVVQG